MQIIGIDDPLRTQGNYNILWGEFEYGAALKQARAGLNGYKIVARDSDMRPTGGNMVELMEAHKRSLKGGAVNAQPPKSPSKRSESSKKRAPKEG